MFDLPSAIFHDAQWTNIKLRDCNKIHDETKLSEQTSECDSIRLLLEKVWSFDAGALQVLNIFTLILLWQQLLPLNTLIMFPCNHLLPTQHKNTIYFDQSGLLIVHMIFPYGQQQQQRGSGYMRLPYKIVGRIFLPVN